GATTADLIVNFTVGGTATNGTDYTTIPTSVTIPAGTASAAVTVSPIDDLLAEASETVVLTLAASGDYRVVSPSAATVTILDNGPPVTIRAPDATAAETGPDPGPFTVPRTGGTTTADLTVNITISGTATNGADYSAIPASVTIPAGQTAAIVAVNPIDDQVG